MTDINETVIEVVRKTTHLVCGFTGCNNTNDLSFRIQKRDDGRTSGVFCVCEDHNKIVGNKALITEVLIGDE